MTPNAASLVKWFQQRPAWFQEAAQRLLVKERLTAEDLRELTEICRAEGVKAKGGKARALPDSAFVKKSAGQALRLDAISDVKGIEALNPRTPLTFTQGSLTIVYDNTGAGKSGYIRIRNNVCGSKNQRKLLGNVFQGPAAQSCKISYTLDGVENHLSWEPSHGQHAALAGLEIYDSECGHTYITNENKVAFEPWLLGLFQRLVDACEAADGLLSPSGKAPVP